ncbi:hypothetical protein HDU97_009678 [Phlyctochytrium planicorne]|nr:hypothetical protein HDU97_009678 [Phlyctochytrium planicorne]
MSIFLTNFETHHQTCRETESAWNGSEALGKLAEPSVSEGQITLSLPSPASLTSEQSSQHQVKSRTFSIQQAPKPHDDDENHLKLDTETPMKARRKSVYAKALRKSLALHLLQGNSNLLSEDSPVKPSPVKVERVEAGQRRKTGNAFKTEVLASIDLNEQLQDDVESPSTSKTPLVVTTTPPVSKETVPKRPPTPKEHIIHHAPPAKPTTSTPSTLIETQPTETPEQDPPNPPESESSARRSSVRRSRKRATETPTEPPASPGDGFVFKKKKPKKVKTKSPETDISPISTVSPTASLSFEEKPLPLHSAVAEKPPVRVLEEKKTVEKHAQTVKDTEEKHAQTDAVETATTKSEGAKDETKGRISECIPGLRVHVKPEDFDTILKTIFRVLGRKPKRQSVVFSALREEVLTELRGGEL